MEDDQKHHEQEEKRKIFREKLLAFKVEAQLLQSTDKAKKVFEALLPDNADKLFLYKALEKRNYLELISYWLTYKEPDDVYGELNEILRKFGLKSYCMTEDMFENTMPFEDWKDTVPLSIENRERLYEHILKSCTHHARYIGHFLLSPTVYLKHYDNHNETEKLLDAIMTEVREDIPLSWTCLKALLLHIGCKKVVEKIEKVILNEKGISTTSTSFPSDYRTQKSESSTIVVQEVLDIVCEDIGDGWSDLAISLGIHPNEVDRISRLNISNKEKMKECFKIKSFNVSWKLLKQQLHKHNHPGVLNRIVEETFITAELKELSSTLRKHYITRYGNVRHIDLFSKFPSSSSTRRSEYVNLYMSNDIGKINRNVNSDRMFNLTNQFRSRAKIEMEDIFKTQNDDFVLIRGIGGIGKSTLADMLVLKWSEEEFLNDIKLLFYIKCREIDEMDGSSLKDFAYNFFGETNFDDIEEISKHVLFVFDGVDELESTKLSKLCDMIKKTYCKPSVSFRVCVTGRPNAIRDLAMKIKKSSKLVDVMGLTSKNQKSFIEKQYRNRSDSKEMVSKMIENIESNPEVKSLATIPLYLQALCYVNDQEKGFDHVTSGVTLNLVMCLYIIQTCYKELDLSNLNLYQVVRHKEILQTLLQLGKLSFHSLVNRQVIFRENDFDADTSYLQNCGILIKYGTERGVYYQFQHLIFQEFLCGLYLFSTSRKQVIDIFKDLTNFSPLWNCLPTIIALQTSISQTRPDTDLMQIFVKEVWNQTTVKLLLDHDIDCLLGKLCQEDVSYSFSLRFLECMSELKRTAPSVIIDNIVEKRGFNIEINSLPMLHYVLRSYSSLFKPIYDRIGATEHVFCNIELPCFLPDKELELMKPFLRRLDAITIRCELNTKLFFSLLNRKSFVEINFLCVRMLSEDLIEYLPYLHMLELRGCKNIPAESAQMLSRYFKEAKSKNEVLLETLEFYRCSSQVIQGMLPCIPYIKSVLMSGCKLSSSTMECLSDTIVEAGRTSNVIELLINGCKIAEGGAKVLSACLRYVRKLDLSNENLGGDIQLTEIDIQAIADSILEQVQAFGKSTLRELKLSSMDAKLFKILLPAIPSLSKLHIICSQIDVKYMERLRDEMKNSNNVLELCLETEFHFDNDYEVAVRKIFAEGSVRLYIADFCRPSEYF